MSQWHEVLNLMQNATGGWVTTHAIYDELHIKNPSQRIDEIERLGGRQVEREVVTINGKRAARYRLVAQTTPVPDPGRVVVEPVSSAEPTALFDLPADRGSSHWKAA